MWSLINNIKLGITKQWSDSTVFRTVMDAVASCLASSHGSNIECCVGKHYVPLTEKCTALQPKMMLSFL